MAAEPKRPDPDALAAAAQREGRAALKIFLGAAPGVGKTFEMLGQARRRREAGLDVVAGIIETHGRRETEEQIGPLPVLPRREVRTDGPDGPRSFAEFDLDAALARRPALLLVDELAHTNVTGSRHRKRWEDVAELLASGIPVWATLNVQHLESLNDTVARITGIRVAETLPDSVLELADEIELVDLPPRELRARLRDGRIYRPELASRALDGFFREGNLTALREIALRRAAQHVDARVLDYMQRHAITGPWPAGERVLALVGPACGEAVVRQAKALADALHAPLLVLHVEVPGAPEGSTGAALALASDLGASVESRAGVDIVREARALARERNVTRIVIGREARRPSWTQFPAQSWRRPAAWSPVRRRLADSLLRGVEDFALLVVPAEPRAAPRRLPPEPAGRRWLAVLVPVLMVASVVAVGELCSAWLEHEALGMLFLATAVGSASLYGLGAGLLAAALGFLSWNFFFIPPLYRFTIDQPRDVVALLVFGGVALITGLMAGRLRTAANLAQSRIEGLRRVGAFSRALGLPATEAALQEEIVRHAAAIAGQAIFLTGGEDTLDIRAADPPADTLDESSWAAARWAYRRGEAAGSLTATLPSSPWRFLPVRISDAGGARLLGLLGVRSATQDGQASSQRPNPPPSQHASKRPSKRLAEPSLQAVEALADQAAVALERIHLAQAAARDAAMAETQKLRTALLSSLGHDLRTPLTGIRGAAETLRGAWTQLSPATREDLLLAIEEDTGRMSRFLDNITQMTRLESGEILPRLARVALRDVVEAALARLSCGPLILHDELGPDSPAVLADPALLEQVVFNILDNAVKYATGQPEISLSARSEPPMVALAIADRGTGIDAADLPHVFDSFFRARRGDRVVAGTGLGLAIARGLVEAMGGAIEAASPVPTGARGAGVAGTLITLRLPATPAGPAASAGPQPAPAARTPVPAGGGAEH